MNNYPVTTTATNTLEALQRALLQAVTMMYVPDTIQSMTMMTMMDNHNDYLRMPPPQPRRVQWVEPEPELPPIMVQPASTIRSCSPCLPLPLSLPLESLLHLYGAPTSCHHHTSKKSSNKTNKSLRKKKKRTKLFIVPSTKQTTKTNGINPSIEVPAAAAAALPVVSSLSAGAAADVDSPSQHGGDTATAQPNLDLVVELVVQNERLLFGNHHHPHGKGGSRRKRPRSRPAKLLSSATLSLAKCLHVLCQRKDTTQGHAATIIDPEDEPELHQWVCDMQHDLQRSCKGLELNDTTIRRQQDLRLVQQLGLAQELFGTKSHRRHGTQQQEPLLPEWTRQFMDHIVKSSVTTDDKDQERSQWIQQQRVEYWAVKATCQDPFSNLQANFRYQLLTSCGVDMDMS